MSREGNTDKMLKDVSDFLHEQVFQFKQPTERPLFRSACPYLHVMKAEAPSSKHIVSRSTCGMMLELDNIYNKVRFCVRACFAALKKKKRRRRERRRRRRRRKRRRRRR